MKKTIFGMPMPGRSWLSDEFASGYRYGYQGQFAEKDPETGYNQFELRLYDARIGRWMVTDPYCQDWSPYMAMGNSPIMLIDPSGGKWWGIFQRISNVMRGNGFNTDKYVYGGMFSEVYVYGKVDKNAPKSVINTDVSTKGDFWNSLPLSRTTKFENKIWEFPLFVNTISLNQYIQTSISSKEEGLTLSKVVLNNEPINAQLKYSSSNFTFQGNSSEWDVRASMGKYSVVFGHNYKKISAKGGFGINNNEQIYGYTITNEINEENAVKVTIAVAIIYTGSYYLIPALARSY